MLEILSFPFIQRALIAGLLVGASLALLGVFVVLRKMSFFGDAIAHFSFTGIALGFLFNINPIFAAVVFSIILAVGIGFIQNKTTISTDTTIGVFFSGAAALGIFIIGLLRGYRSDLFQYLFGDILAITSTDIWIAFILTATIILTFTLLWRPFFKITFNREMALTSGLPVAALEYIFMILLAAATAIAIKIVGIILVTALLIIPAATAKNIAKNFKEMIVYTLIFGLLSVLVGLFASYFLNTASGPSIVLVGIILFAISSLFRK